MDMFLLIVRTFAHLGAAYLLIQYVPDPRSRYRFAVSSAATLLAGASLAGVFHAWLVEPWAHLYIFTALAVALFLALLHCRGNLAHILRFKQ